MPHALRLCEYGTCDTGDSLAPWQRDVLAHAAQRWQEDHRLNIAPLRWEGRGGTVLRAAQFVGVVEAAGVAVEIYPKLDKAALTSGAVGDGNAPTVLSNLLWMMETAQEAAPPDTDSGSLAECPQSYAELFALLLARRLWGELRRGRIREYVTFADDLHTVRGRLNVRAQATRLSGRMDRQACRWDELTADVVVNRVLACACRVLRARVRGAVVAGLLENCLCLLDDVEPVSPADALRLARGMTRWGRGAERFRVPFALAVRLLRDMGHEMQTGRAETFVFLQNMNDLWEAYVGALLRELPGVRVGRKRQIGRLFPKLPVGGILQEADYVLHHLDGRVWIGDAKYKHLAAGQNHPLRFSDEAESIGQGHRPLPISPDDIRQLTTYAELALQNGHTPSRPDLLLLYPYVGDWPLTADTAQAWNGSAFTLVPVGVDPTQGLRGNLPEIMACSPILS